MVNIPHADKASAVIVYDMPICSSRFLMFLKNKEKSLVFSPFEAMDSQTSRI
jgi:hypothetical protein